MKIFQFALAIAVASTHFVYAGAERPNMLIVLVDDHAFEAISAYTTVRLLEVGETLAKGR